MLMLVSDDGWFYLMMVVARGEDGCDGNHGVVYDEWLWWLNLKTTPPLGIQLKKERKSKDFVTNLARNSMAFLLLDKIYTCNLEAFQSGCESPVAKSLSCTGESIH